MGLAAPVLAARLGSHATVVLTLVALIAGQLIRAVLPGTAALFAGSLIALAGIAVGNVLLPGLVRLHFPDRIPAMTAAYTTLLTIGGAAAAAVTLPVERALGGDWRTGPRHVGGHRGGGVDPLAAAGPPAPRGTARERSPVPGCRCPCWPAPGWPGRWRCTSAASRWWPTSSSAGSPEILTDTGMTDTAAAAMVASRSPSASRWPRSCHRCSAGCRGRRSWWSRWQVVMRQRFSG